MDVAKIQREVRRLPARERKKLTTWMVTEFPVLSVERLMRKAARGEVGYVHANAADQGQFSEGKSA